MYVLLIFKGNVQNTINTRGTIDRYRDTPLHIDALGVVGEVVILELAIDISKYVLCM